MGSFRTRRNKTHTLCVRCGCRSFHLQKSPCPACAYQDNWNEKLLGCLADSRVDLEKSSLRLSFILHMSFKAAGLGTQTAQMDDFRLAEQRSMAVESDHLLLLFKSNTELWRKEDIYVSLCSCACNNDPFELLCDDRTFRGRLRLKRRVRNI
ncbi:unnamed protein product [Trifolium pratense]|uniref:Uncharacterized protein n=1 Tax=Trifolium pratense TaxID=57577 RepID=A0ACB0J3G8_TRIPR|nr:unnamed protein product [Trifolium pratense]